MLLDYKNKKQSNNQKSKRIISLFAKYLFVGAVLGAITVNKVPILGIIFPIAGGIIGEYKERKEYKQNKSEEKEIVNQQPSDKIYNNSIKYKIHGKEYTKEEIQKSTELSHLNEKQTPLENTYQKTYERR